MDNHQSAGAAIGGAQSLDADESRVVDEQQMVTLGSNTAKVATRREQVTAEDLQALADYLVENPWGKKDLMQYMRDFQSIVSHPPHQSIGNSSSTFGV